MADIEKRLKLIAELDDRKIKRQIDQLKKDLESLKFKGEDLSGFSKSASILKDAAKELRDAIQQFSRISPQKINAVAGARVTSPGGAAGGGAGGGGARGGRRGAQVREIFDPEAGGGRGRNVRLRDEQQYSPITQRVYKNQQQLLEAERNFRIRMQEDLSRRKEAELRREFQQRERFREQQRRQRERFVRGGLTAAGRQFGLGLPQSRQIVETV